MLRSLFAAVFVPVFALAVSLSASDPAAAGQADDIVAVLRLPEVFSVISAEGDAYGHEIDDNMMDGTGGAAWEAAVRQIYAPERLLPAFTAALGDALTQSRDDMAPAIAFFRSDLGQQATGLEISARRALLDPDVEDASRLKLEEMRAEESARLALIDDFVAANDLVESNVSSGLNANYAFYQGLRDAGAIGTEMTDDDVVAEVWSQEGAIREETDTWVHSYLTMAYAPLSDDDLRHYTEVSRTPGAQALNRAMATAFAKVFTDVSRQLGRAAGAVLAGQSL
jgi:hypothetical protein